MTAGQWLECWFPKVIFVLLLTFAKWLIQRSFEATFGCYIVKNKTLSRLLLIWGYLDICGCPLNLPNCRGVRQWPRCFVTALQVRNSAWAWLGGLVSAPGPGSQMRRFNFNRLHSLAWGWTCLHELSLIYLVPGLGWLQFGRSRNCQPECPSMAFLGNVDVGLEGQCQASKTPWLTMWGSRSQDEAMWPFPASFRVTDRQWHYIPLLAAVGSLPDSKRGDRNPTPWWDKGQNLGDHVWKQPQTWTVALKGFWGVAHLQPKGYCETSQNTWI